MLSRPQLIELIQRNSLYQTELRSSSLSEVIETMRGAIAIEPVTADIQATNGGRRSTIAFGMSFFYSDPVKAQAVAQALTEQVLQIDASKTAAQAVNTVEFLTDQETDLQTQISQLEGALGQIKAENGLALSAGNLGGLYSGGGGIEGQIAALQASNAQLVAQRDITRSSADRDPVITQAEQALAAAQASYSDKHPDVILAKQRLAEAKELAKSNQTRIPLNALEAQLASNNRQIALLQSARSTEASRSATIMNAQMRAPLVIQQVNQMQQRLDGLNAQYQRVQNQLMTAKAGKKAEDEQQGERLSLIDPPQVPDEPTSPNRPVIISTITAAGIALGLGLILFIELLMKPIRDAGAVIAATGEAPLVVIPTIMTKGERKKTGFKSLWPFGGGDNDDDEDDDDDDDAVKVRAKGKK